MTIFGKLPDYNLTADELEVGCVHSHFLDSGSFSLWTKAATYAQEMRSGPFAYYDTQEFYDYMDAYAAFVKTYAYGIDHFANVDAIPNPEVTYRNQKYFEREHEIFPVPVVHYPCSPDVYLKRYIDEGYTYIAIGGLVGSTKQDACQGWIDRVFDLVCNTPDRLPMVRLHGFGVTSYDLLIRYPWYSADSASWTKVAGYGGILVPHKRGGAFSFKEQPYILKVSQDSPNKGKRGQHFFTISKAEQRILSEWLEYINVPLGRLAPDGLSVTERGVITSFMDRRAANIRFFQTMISHLPDYPWAFRSNRLKGFF